MGEPRKLLVITPHPDDETLGVGGIIARFAASGVQVTVLTVSAHSPPLYPQDVRDQTVSEARRAHRILGVTHSIFLDHPAVLLNELRTAEFNREISEVVRKVEPQILLIPYPDRHIDHRLIFDAAMVASRPVAIGRNIGLVASYETLSETHWNAPHIEPNFTPNACIDITNFIDCKLEALAQYESQIPPFPGSRSLEAVKALSHFRGSQNGFPYGEGLHIIRLSVPPEVLAA